MLSSWLYSPKPSQSSHKSIYGGMNLGPGNWELNYTIISQCYYYPYTSLTPSHSSHKTIEMIWNPNFLTTGPIFKLQKSKMLRILSEIQIVGSWLVLQTNHLISPEYGPLYTNFVFIINGRWIVLVYFIENDQH